MKSTIFFNITSVFYFLACIFFIVHLVYNKKDRLNVISKFLTAFGFFLHTAGIVFRIVESGHAPFVNLYESVIYFSWAIILFYLYIQFKYPLLGLDIFVTAISFLALVYANTLSSNIQPLVPILQSIWLEIHVAVIFIGYAAFTISYACSLMYLLKVENKRAFLFAALNICFIVVLIIYFLLKIKFNQSIISLFILSGVFVFIYYLLNKIKFFLNERLPAVDVIDKIGYKAVAYGFPFLTFGIIAGAVWANEAWGSYWSWDPKETWSLITWFIYAVYLHARKTAGWTKLETVYLTIYGFLAVMFTYFGVNFLLPGLHSYG